MRLRKYLASVSLLTLVSSALVVVLAGCGATEAAETMPGLSATAEAEVDKIMAVRLAARTPTPQPTSTPSPAIQLASIEIGSIAGGSGLDAEGAATPLSQRPQPPTISTSPLPRPDISELANQARPAIVAIGTPSGMVTGVIFSPHGFILTSYHAIVSNGVGNGVVDVWVHDGDPIPGTVLGYDESLGLAVVKIDGSSWPVLPITAYLPSAGEEIILAGYVPGQVEMTSFTSGLVSGFRPGESLILAQASGLINEPNGSGAAFNISGQFIGLLRQRAVVEEAANAISIVALASVAEEIPRLIAGGRSVASAQR